MGYISQHGWLAAIIVGLIVGSIAKLFMPGKDPSGCIVTIVIGMVGSVVAGYLGSAVFGWYRDGEPVGWIMSILGAMLVLYIYRLVVKNRS